MKNPAVLWYPSDFIASTALWNNEQCGAYIRLLNYQFILGHLTMEQIKMVTNDALVKSKFILDKKGLFFNQRMELEIDKRTNYIDSRSKNRLGKTKEKQQNHMKNISKTYEKHMGNINININNSIKYNKYGIYKRILLSIEQYNKLIEEYTKDYVDNQINLLDEYIESNNNKNKYSNWNLILRKSIRENWFKNKIPMWLGKEVKQETSSKEELAELEDMLKEFREGE